MSNLVDVQELRRASQAIYIAAEHHAARDVSEKLKDAADEIERLRDSRIVTCVYCGHVYPNGTPTAQHELLTQHIAQCEKHPLRAAEIEIRKLRNQLNRGHGYLLSLRPGTTLTVDNVLEAFEIK